MELLIISLLTLGASVIGTAGGFGISTLMVPVMLLFLPLAPALLFVGLIHIAGDAWKILLFRRGFRWRIIMWFGIPGTAAAILGARLALAGNNRVILRVLGIFLIMYSVFLLMRPSFRLSQKPLAAAAGGTLSGLLAGIFGVGGAARSAGLAAFDLNKETYISTNGAIALFIDLARLATYLSGGASLPQPLWQGMVIFIPLTFAGAWLARRLVSAIPQDRFRPLVALFLFLFGIKFLFFP